MWPPPPIPTSSGMLLRLISVFPCFVFTARCTQQFSSTSFPQKGNADGHVRLENVEGAHGLPTVQKGLLRRVVSRKSTYAFSFSVCIACFKRNVFRKDRFVDFCLQTCVSKTACLPSMCWRRKERKAQAIKQRPHCDLEEMSQTFRKSRNYEGQSRRIWTLFLAMSVLDSRRCSITDPKSPRIEPRTVQVAISMFRPCRRRLNCAIDGR